MCLRPHARNRFQGWGNPLNIRTYELLLELQVTVNSINVKVDKLMSEQDELNTDVANLVAAVAAVSAEIDALKAANPALDLSALEAAIGSVQALAPAAPPAT